MTKDDQVTVICYINEFLCYLNNFYIIIFFSCKDWILDEKKKKKEEKRHTDESGNGIKLGKM